MGDRVHAEPDTLFGVGRVLDQVAPTKRGNAPIRWPDADEQTDSVLLSVAAANRVVGAQVQGGLKCSGHHAATLGVGECVLQHGDVIAADLVERDDVGPLGANHRGGLRYRPARVATGDAAITQVHLQHLERR